jgi:AcrR family transcriptional regulator
MTESKDKRQQILAATLQLIVANGLERTPMSAVGRAAGVGMGTIYHYFPSKEELINVLYRELKAQSHMAMLRGYRVDAPVRARFFCIWRNIFHLYREQQDLYRFLEQYSFSPVITPESKAYGDSTWSEAHRVIEDGLAQQILKPLPVKLLLRIAGAPLFNLVQGHITGEIVLDEALIEEAVTACWDAIKR